VHGWRRRQRLDICNRCGPLRLELAQVEFSSRLGDGQGCGLFRCRCLSLFNSLHITRCHSGLLVAWLMVPSRLVSHEIDLVMVQEIFASVCSSTVTRCSR